MRPVSDKVVGSSSPSRGTPNGIKHSSARRVTRLIRKSAQKSSCVQVRGGHWSGATSSCHSPVFKAEQARTAPGHGCLAWEAAVAEDENWKHPSFPWKSPREGLEERAVVFPVYPSWESSHRAWSNLRKLKRCSPRRKNCWVEEIKGAEMVISYRRPLAREANWLAHGLSVSQGRWLWPQGNDGEGSKEDSLLEGWWSAPPIRGRSRKALSRNPGSEGLGERKSLRPGRTMNPGGQCSYCLKADSSARKVLKFQESKFFPAPQLDMTPKSNFWKMACSGLGDWGLDF